MFLLKSKFYAKSKHLHTNSGCTLRSWELCAVPSWYYIWAQISFCLDDLGPKLKENQKTSCRLYSYLCFSIFWCKYSFDIEWHVFIFLGLWKYRSNQIIASYFNYLNYLFAAELLRDHCIWVLYDGHIKHLKNCYLTTNPLCCYFVHSATLLIFQGVLEDWRRYLGKVFKNEPSKICERQPLKNLKWHGLPKQYYTETNTEHFPLIH